MKETTEMNNKPRAEHPNPQFERKNWTNLNGEWEFEIDYGKSGIERKFYERDSLDSKIIVPFCPESELSGVGHKDFMAAVWYRRIFPITKQQLSGRVILHFGAVDYEAVVYVNQKEVGRHCGGYTSFSFDITDFVAEGENVLTVCAIDDVRNPYQPRGKQSEMYYSHECDYTRTTGIWQTVWLEYIPQNYIKNVWFYPDADNCKVTVKVDLQGGGTLEVFTAYQGKETGKASVVSKGGTVWLELPLTEKYLWECGNGRLYDVTLNFGEDEVKSYFGLRNIRFGGMKFLLNDKPVFQRLVLDQGFYPDGIYTAPTEEALIRDIELSLAAGFNGARLHEKVFEPRFLYHCDRMGYMVWGEYANWGFDHTDIDGLSVFLKEWSEVVTRDFNHPAIVCWCPFNETWDLNGRQQENRIIESVYRETKVLDSTRPCVDTSGHFHVITDIFDIHDYDQNPETFSARYCKLEQEGVCEYFDTRMDGRMDYNGEPICLSEYGGIQWDESKISNGWGYGNAPKTKEEFLLRLKGLTDALLDNGSIFGFCYTQLYDVEQEVNGLYTYERKPKFDSNDLYRIFRRKAKVEAE